MRGRECQDQSGEAAALFRAPALQPVRRCPVIRAARPLGEVEHQKHLLEERHGTMLQGGEKSVDDERRMGKAGEGADWG